jgi:cellobiose phosphorylase
VKIYHLATLVASPIKQTKVTERKSGFGFRDDLQKTIEVTVRHNPGEFVEPV